MDQFNVIHEAAQQGLPGEMLLVFTMVLWCIFTLILLADLHNKLNNWCFISGILFSVGALKEYLFYTLGPQLIQASIWTDDFSEGLYSVLSAVFYYLAMPSVLVFAFFQNIPVCVRLLCSRGLLFLMGIEEPDRLLRVRLVVIPDGLPLRSRAARAGGGIIRPAGVAVGDAVVCSRRFTIASAGFHDQVAGFVWIA